MLGRHGVWEREGKGALVLNFLISPLRLDEGRIRSRVVGAVGLCHIILVGKAGSNAMCSN